MTQNIPTLKTLINQLCPNGVEFKELGKACIIKTGQGVSKTDIDQNPGQFPVINSGRDPLGFFDKYNTENDPIGITSRGAGVGSITWCEGKYFRGNLNYSATIFDKNELNVRFLFHVLLYDQSGIQQIATYQGIPALNKSSLEKLKIPIPPLDIQKEIVRILDSFTKLEAELEAELEARKKQYEFFRDKLLSSEKDIEWKTLGEIVNIKHGKDYKNFKTGDIPVYGSGGIMTHIDTFSYDKPSVLIPRKGTITNIFYAETPFWNVDTIYYTEIDTDQIIPKYFYYYMKTVDLESLDTGTGRPSLTMLILNKIKIPVPSLPKQKRIVEILDKFDALVNDISIGLPAELKARRQQYEYYRNQLLSFKEYGRNI